MKSLDANLQTHLEGTIQTLATLWKVTRVDGTIMGFTDHQSNIILDGVTYRAATGFTASSIVTSVGLSVDNLELEGLLSSDQITEADILHGKYDYAEIIIGMVNYADLTQAALVQRKGWLGEVSLRNGTFYAEMRGLTQLLSQNITEVYSPDCRAKLGDARCGYNFTTNGFPFSGTVTTALSRRMFTTGFTQANGYFAFGKVVWLTGLNAGLQMEIIQYNNASGQFVLFLPMPFNIQAGDTFNLWVGCDKRFATCRDKFSNGANFRGEPYIPTGDQAMAYPNAH